MRIELNCPRTGCGTPIGVNRAAQIDTHKLPDGWRVCAASGKTMEEAIVLPPPVADPGPTAICLGD